MSWFSYPSTFTAPIARFCWTTFAPGLGFSLEFVPLFPYRIPPPFCSCAKLKQLVVVLF